MKEIEIKFTVILNEDDGKYSAQFCIVKPSDNQGIGIVETRGHASENQAIDHTLIKTAECIRAFIKQYSDVSNESS